MTTDEPIEGIQARIEDLQNTIAEKEEQIRERARQLKEELQRELSAEKIIKRHPLKAAGTALAAGFLIGRSLKKSRQNIPVATECVPAQRQPSVVKSAIIGSIGVDLLRSLKDIGLTRLQRYIDRKML